MKQGPKYDAALIADQILTTVTVTLYINNSDRGSIPMPLSCLKHSYLYKKHVERHIDNGHVTLYKTTIHFKIAPLILGKGTTVSIIISLSKHNHMERSIHWCSNLSERTSEDYFNGNKYKNQGPLTDSKRRRMCCKSSATRPVTENHNKHIRVEMLHYTRVSHHFYEWFSNVNELNQW